MKFDAHIACTVLDNNRHSLPILGHFLFAVDTSDMDVCQDGKIVCNCCLTLYLVHVSWDLGIFSSRSSLLSSSGFGSFWHYLRGYACMTDYLEMWSWQIWNIKFENGHWAQCNLIPFEEFDLLCMVKSCVHNCPILVQGFAMFGFHILLWE